MSAPAQDRAPAPEALAFRQWLKESDRYRRPETLTQAILVFAVCASVMWLSAILLDWAGHPWRDGELDEYRHFVVSIFPLLIACLPVTVAIGLSGPADAGSAWRLYLLALLAGLLAMTGEELATEAVAAFVPDFEIGALLFLPALIAGTVPGFALALGTAYRFRAPAPVVQPPPAGALKTIAGYLVILPAGAAAYGFALIHGWTEPAECGPPLGAGIMGFSAVAIGGTVIAKAWGHAGAMRGAMLREWGFGLLIVLAAVPLGHLFDCTPVATVSPTTGGGLDRAVFLQLFGGYALPVYLAAGMLAAWRMDRFLARHGLRMQDRVAGEEAEA